MRWLALLTAFAVLYGTPVATQTTTADQAPPSVLATGIQCPVAVDTPKSFDEWLADLTTRRAARLQRRPDRGDARRTSARSSGSSRATAARPSSTPASRDTHARLTPVDGRAAAGTLSAEHKALLDRTENANSASRARVLVAFWGMESRFGRIQGSTPVFQALATLAWEPRRATVLPQRALQRVDDGAARAYRSAAR